MSVGIVEIAVFRSELFCLYGDGHLSHLSLLSAERCVERLLRREAWILAATVSCMFQHAVASGRVGLHTNTYTHRRTLLHVQIWHDLQPLTYTYIETQITDILHQTHMHRQ